MQVIDWLIFVSLFFVMIFATRARWWFALVLFLFAPLAALMLEFLLETSALVLTGELAANDMSSLPSAALLFTRSFPPLSPNGALIGSLCIRTHRLYENHLISSTSSIRGRLIRGIVLGSVVGLLVGISVWFVAAHSSDYMNGLLSGGAYVRLPFFWMNSRSASPQLRLMAPSSLYLVNMQTPLIRCRDAARAGNRNLSASNSAIPAKNPVLAPGRLRT
jgi:hypothetical protein